MKAIKARISLNWSDPLIYRDVLLPEDMTLPALHRLIHAVLEWDNSHMHAFVTKKRKYINPDEDDVYWETTVGDWLSRKGSNFGYLYDWGDSWMHRIESLGKEKVSADQKLPVLIGGENAGPPEDSGGMGGYYDKLAIMQNPDDEESEWIREWMGEDFDAASFNLEEKQAIIASIDWSDFDDVDDEDNDDFFGGLEGEGSLDFIDLDLGTERSINFEWLKKEHGILLTEDHIRNIPKEIIDFLEEAESFDDPTPFLSTAEGLFKKHPNSIDMASAVASMHSFLGHEAKALRILKNLPQSTPDNVYFNLSFIMNDDDSRTFMKRVGKFPQPLSITNLPPGKGGYYHVDELMLFEEMAIRYELGLKNLDSAVDRLDRLVIAGFHHNDVRMSAMMITTEQIALAQELMQKHQANPNLPVPKKAEEVSPRTQEILGVSIQDTFDLINKSKGGDFDSMLGGFDDDDFDDYTPSSHRSQGLKAVHSPQMPLTAETKVGRNDSCPCGSGKKYKQCCLRK